jgi:diaminopimelate epimerase
MLVNFMKMHGLGNDFVVLDRITQNLYLNTAQIQRIADRKLGIGCDQVILVEPPIQAHSDFYYRIFNADGTEVEQCGNGVRCAARFVYDMGIIKKTSLLADCLAGPIGIRLEKNHLLTVNMGIPATNDCSTHAITGFDTPLSFLKVDIGNPHAVIFVPKTCTPPFPSTWAILEKQILDTGLFPDGVNIEWVYIDTPNSIRVRVLERGVGETLACGSGASACVIAGRKLGLLEQTVNVQFAMGRLRISWAGAGTSLFMTGPAIGVFQGRFRF